MSNLLFVDRWDFFSYQPVDLSIIPVVSNLIWLMFYVVKTVQFGMILYNDQRNAHAVNFIYLFTSALHVSGCHHGASRNRPILQHCFSGSATVVLNC
jgi:hypothetical protein